MENLILPNWPIENVRAFSTTRHGGVSTGAFSSLNFGQRVGDDLKAVQKNRALLRQHLPTEPFWLKQVHGNRVVNLPSELGYPEADATVTREKGKICIIQTADCLPILLSAKDGAEVAAIHAGWKSLALGIIAKTVATLITDPGKLIAWLGPAIGQAAFEVGPEVKTQFTRMLPSLDSAFIKGKGDRYHADLHHIAKQLLSVAEVSTIYACQHCTYSEADTFFSYRRDQITGRMVTVIYRT